MAHVSQTAQDLPSDREGSLLLNLPVELRLYIWEYVFPGGEYIPLVIHSSRGTMSILRQLDTHGKPPTTFGTTDTDRFAHQIAWGRHRRALLRHGYQLKSLVPAGGIFQHGNPTMLLSLALTCHSVYAEVIPMLYGNSTFGFYEEHQLFHFLQHVPFSNLCHIRHIVVCLRRHTCKTSPEWIVACDTLLSLPKLGTLDFVLFNQSPVSSWHEQPPDSELMEPILEQMVPFKGKSARGQFNFWDTSSYSHKWQPIFDKEEIPFIVKNVEIILD